MSAVDHNLNRCGIVTHTHMLYKIGPIALTAHIHLSIAGLPNSLSFVALTAFWTLLFSIFVLNRAACDSKQHFLTSCRLLLLRTHLSLRGFWQLAANCYEIVTASIKSWNVRYVCKRCNVNLAQSSLSDEICFDFAVYVLSLCNIYFTAFWRLLSGDDDDGSNEIVHKQSCPIHVCCLGLVKN